MEKRNFTVSSAHARHSHEERAAALHKYRSGETRLLITTDVDDHGVDVAYIPYVINFDLPKNFEHYMVRGGRMGKFGRRGNVFISLVAQEDIELLRSIEKFYDTLIDELPADF
jgi:superfamily II DNA/RNA helicase